MAQKHRLIADLFFLVQIAMALLFCGSQFVRALSSVEGVSLSMYLLYEVFMGLHFALAYSAYKLEPSRIAAQLRFIYAFTILLIAADIGAIALNGHYRWTEGDTIDILLAVLGGSVLYMYSTFRGRGIEDPMVKGLLAIGFKSLPQLFFAYKIVEEGGYGTPGLVLITGHIAVLIRLGQIWFSIRQSRQRDRNRFWLAASEITNETTWTIATIAWVVWYFS